MVTAAAIHSQEAPVTTTSSEGTVTTYCLAGKAKTASTAGPAWMSAGTRVPRRTSPPTVNALTVR